MSLNNTTRLAHVLQPKHVAWCVYSPPYLQWIPQWIAPLLLAGDAVDHLAVLLLVLTALIG
jgi:hypothetical protein